MSIVFGSEITRDINLSSEKEWLETNGLGGWASGTIAGIHTRRYHGLLVGAMHPPVGRLVLLSKMPETVITSAGQFELDCNSFNGVIHPQGYLHLEKYTQDFFPEFEYLAGGIRLKKTVAMVYGENTTLLLYEVLEANEVFTLKLKPFVAFRDYHWLGKANENISLAYNFNESVLKVAAYQEMPALYIKVPGSEFHYSPDWYYNYQYKIEQERGHDFKEDLFTYGDFYVKLKKGDRLEIVVSTDDPKVKDARKLFESQLKRKKSLIDVLPVKDEFAKTLTLAADQFIVKRAENLKTIIAGYHWFSDWGRDTMIALPGLCLVTGRYDDAKKILRAFAKVIDQGMIPNRFPDEGETPEYNTVDATLWYFVAIYKYLQYSKDEVFVKDELYPALKEIIEWHINGTRYHIHVDEDGLLFAGEPGSQLTWMDAKVGDWVVTPRDGKPVEINALWYNSLRIMEDFASRFDDKSKKGIYQSMAEKAEKSFSLTFINEETGCLYDVVKWGNKDASIRPNQLFAISLPFVLVNKTVAKAMLGQVEKDLLTTRGLRSLSINDPQYKPYYRGNQLARDGSYHQGTTWSWPIGAYLEAKMKTYGKPALPRVKAILAGFEKHFEEAGIGTVSEIFDGNAPYAPKGCMAQAWGVAELLRIYFEYVVTEGKE